MRTGGEPALVGIWSFHRLHVQKRCGLFRPRCSRQAKFAPAEPIFEHKTPWLPLGGVTKNQDRLTARCLDAAAGRRAACFE